MAYHSTSNWLGEPIVVGCQLDPDDVYERMREDIEIQNALDAQMKLFPRADYGAQKEGAA